METKTTFSLFFTRHNFALVHEIFGRFFNIHRVKSIQKSLNYRTSTDSKQRPRGPGCTQARTHALGDLLRRQLGNGMRGMAANQVSEQPQSGVQAWAEALVRQHGGREAVLARAEALVRAHGGREAVLARAEALVRAPGGSEAVLAREAYHRNLQSHPTLRCLEPFARVGDVAAAQGDLVPRIVAGFTGLPGPPEAAPTALRGDAGGGGRGGPNRRRRPYPRPPKLCGPGLGQPAGESGLLGPNP